MWSRVRRLPASMMQHILIRMITMYRTWISPLMPPACRFYPTCSEYGLQAITRYGALKGSWLTLRRFLRCHPFCQGGYDPVE
ncbi:membrane protein insertion efficiency factor YidD [candidate division KSB3 bacterium]|uniref:Putative membrane protein insertion efficiency factor n=1 Tax=candidate division KSB3 bacterium TaxID=2044937 RepID=A0A9D5JRW7_9BACT|nr:membrane protein insertion efficiency factor YidD [candidate division KSB3 bacterium]MBD3323048.1 membrane protein insertion efficiency factor YidD [candidate division KSB3 bacterium]